MGLFAPAKTPGTIIALLNEEAAEILRLPEVLSHISRLGTHVGAH